jgi:FkbM family methyltransferase
MFDSVKRWIWGVSSRTPPFRGKERLVALLSRPRRVSYSQITRQGVRWSLHGHDLNEFAIAVRPNHSPLLSASIAAEIVRRDVKVLWDIGANVGAIALPLLREFAELRAVLFEPSAEVAGRLIRNLSNNPDLFQRATIVNVALSESEGICNFFVSNETFNSGVAGLGHSHNRFQFAVRVQAYPGDRLVDTGICPVPQLIKIDVEGFELEVFRGLRATLERHRPTIVFEHSLYRLRERNQDSSSVTSFLESLGYAVYRLSDGLRVTPDDLGHDADFIARAVDTA